MPSSPTWRLRLRNVVGVLSLSLALFTTATILAIWWSLQHPILAQLHPDHAETFRIAGVAVVDVEAGTASGPMDVEVLGDRITGIWPSNDAPVAPAAVVDGRGRWLVPGLIDAHCHVVSDATPPWIKRLPDPQLSFERLLYSGVTRVFDPGSAAPVIFHLREELETGVRLGPALHAAGPVFTAVGGHPVPMAKLLAPPVLRDIAIPLLTRQVDSPESATAHVQDLVPHRPDFVKMVVDRLPQDAPLLSARLATAIVDAAEAEDLRTVAHIGTVDDAVVAARAGATAWIHGIYKESVSTTSAEELAKYGIPMIPTMVVFRAYGEMARGEYPETQLERDVMSDADLASRADPTGRTGSDPSIQLYVDMLREQRQSALDNVGHLHAAGVTMLAGSDAQSGVITGPSLHRELLLLHRAGLTPAEVLRAATLDSARFLANSADPPYGSVAVGKRADLLMVRSNPLEDPAALSDIDEVFAAGRRILRTPWPRE